MANHLARGRPEMQLRELREVSADRVGRVADELKYATGEAHAVEVLSQCEGFSRFCRQSLGVEPLALMAALDLGREDPAVEVLASQPDVRADEAKAAEWAVTRTREWEQRIAW